MKLIKHSIKTKRKALQVTRELKKMYPKGNLRVKKTKKGFGIISKKVR